MSDMTDTRAEPTQTSTGIQFGEIVRVTRHQHNQHDWRNPFERRRATSLPEEFMRKLPLKPSPRVDGVGGPGSADDAALQELPTR